MANFADLKAQVATDLRRSNLGPEIAKAVLDAIRDHDSERFYFNDYAVYTLTLIQGIDEYNLAPQAPIQEFIKIDTVRAQQSTPNGSWYTVVETTTDDIEVLYSNPSTGEPARWATHGINTIRFWPTPNRTYPIRIFGHYRMIPLAVDTDSNDWTNAGQNLIRYTALRRLFVTPVRDADQMMLMQTAGQAELDYLRRETDRRARRGRMTAYYG